ncbi:hypothetical protein GE061_018562 [Apolygus lucorum]|uniref:Uncharacterized protein n=1 Tax=Apolygus lucorum TaxID=248454 RepID=A0A8S9XGA0_APOLU|nr:hypothetical protein GE061_018562 [Apolygus lucorum]
MVFQNGGRRRATEHWNLGGESIEIVSSYQYLGVELIHPPPRLSFTKHVERKAQSAKFALNNIWGRLFANPAVPLKAKSEVFNATIRAILCYTSPSWGFQEYAKAEGVQLMYIRKLFRLPKFSPNYILYLETGVDTISAFTLEAHLKYLKKVAHLPDTRLPKLIAMEVMRSGVSWAGHLGRLATGLGVIDGLHPLSFESIRLQAAEILERFKEHKKQWFWQRAMDSERRGQPSDDVRSDPHVPGENLVDVIEEAGSLL